jgi:energy-coupling factor transporter transmembrane protein EcfT
VLLGIKPPDIVVQIFIWTISTTAPLFLTVGMFRIWRLPDRRRWMAVPASAFLILSAILIFGAVVQHNRVDEYHKALTESRASVAWQTAKANYDGVLSDYQVLAARTFPADYPTWFEANERAKAKKWKLVEETSASVVALEPSVVKGSSSVFDIFGQDLAWLVFSFFLALYSVVNEMIAMALSHRVAVKAKKPREVESETAEHSTAPQHKIPPVFGEEAYLKKARELGRNGNLAGALAVSAATGQTEWTCKVIVRNLIAKGRVFIPEGSTIARERTVQHFSDHQVLTP